METWKRVWRDGLTHKLTDDMLAGLRDALASDDVRLVQGVVCSPPPVLSGLRVETACAIGFCGWRAGMETVGAVEYFFQEVCDAADAKLGEPAASRYFLNWFDDAPRDVMRRELLSEVRAELARRAAGPVEIPEGGV